MATPYRQLASPTRDLAAAAALPPDAYHPRGRWATVGRQLGWVFALLGAAEVAHLALGSTLPALGCFVAAYAVLFGNVIRRRRMALRLIRENDEAVAQLNGAELESAVRRLDALAVQSRGLGFYHAQVVFNRGVAFIRQGQPEHALALFDAVARSGWFERFRATAESIPEVVEFYRMSGDIDYLLRVVVPDIAAYDAVYKRLTRGTDLADVSSSFAMQELKFTTAVPLDYA